MSTLEEMGRDLERAIELEDYDAALEIAVGMDEEASALGFEELGQELITAMQLRHYSSVLGIARHLARKGAETDIRRNEAFGTRLAEALTFVDLAYAADGRNN